MSSHPVSLAPAATVPLTYLIVSGDVIRETQLGFSWRDALDALWTGDFDDKPRLVAINIRHGLCLTCTTAALRELAERAEAEGEVPAHLEPHFRAAGIEVRTGGMRLTGGRRIRAVLDQTGGRFSSTGFGGRA